MDEVLTEVPQNLQMLVRLVVRGFYSIEDVLIVDMLVRNLCMSEEDLCELLKFDRKMLRQRISTLKGDKLLQARTKTLSLEDGKTQREQYYFINYKSFVNVVKYKLDHIRKKLEMEEREQTSRASFKCENCNRTYTDLEADQLLDMKTGDLVCVMCHCEIVEDTCAMPRHDTRILLSRFNDQMEPLFSLLREVENIKLAAEFSEPKPQDFSSMKKSGQEKSDKKNSNGDNSRSWSGDASKNQGFQVDSSIDVSIAKENGIEEVRQVKEKPIWLTDTTSLISTNITSIEPSASEADIIPLNNDGTVESKSSTSDDVLSLLQQHESKDKTEQSPVQKPSATPTYNRHNSFNHPILGAGSIEEITISDDEDDDDNESEPLIQVGNRRVPITDIDDELIAEMTQEEKNNYITAYQEYYAAMED